MGLQGSDLAILTARFGAGRFGASRFGFIPCPEDVLGTGFDEPGQYVWLEDPPPTTTWTLQNEDCVCRDLCTLSLGEITLDGNPIVDVDVTASVTLSGVIGNVSGVARINWGDGRHDQQDFDLLEDGAIEFGSPHGHYHVEGDYTITVTVTDERGCSASQTLAVTVGAGLSGEIGISTGDGVMTFTPTVTGGSETYTFAWSAWTEYGGSEGSPAYTSSDEQWDLDTVPIGFPIVAGFVKLVVTDSVTMATLTLGPDSWVYP